MSEHTETPWYAGGGSMDFGNYIIQTHKGAIAHVHPPNAPANVEFIVRACNYHEALLADLKLFVAAVQDGNDAMLLIAERRARRSIARVEVGK